MYVEFAKNLLIQEQQLFIYLQFKFRHVNIGEYNRRVSF